MSSGLKGKWVKIPCYPVAVKEESYCVVSTGKLGRSNRVMMLEPEDLPVLMHYNSTGDRGCWQ